MPNNYPAGNVRGELNLVHSGMSVTENLKKNLAGHYLHNPGSRVNVLRMRRSRSGTVKVLILLEIDDDTVCRLLVHVATDQETE